MKKLILLFLNSIIIILLLSCNNYIYKNGVFIGEGDIYSKGSDDAIVSIDNGKIVDLTLRHLDINKKEINYDEWTGQEINGVINPNLRKFRGDFIQTVLESQSGEINIIDEIPEISANWKLAINRALKKAKK